MKPELRLLTAIAVMVLASATSVARNTFVPPVIRFSEPEPLPPQILFAIPKYALTTQDRETVAACLILEAASQGDYGMRAVMAVIRNRARGLPELFAPTVLRPKQFSALNRITAGYEPLPRAIARAKRDRMWHAALVIVEDAVAETWYDPTGGATHYTRSAERTRWTHSLAKTVTIGAHSFYR